MPLKTFLCVLCVLCGWNSPVLAQDTKPQIAIIIDDIGNNYAHGLRAVELPGPVAYAFLPHTPYSEELARLAHKNNKEVMLHLPLQATSHNDLLGPGNLKLHDGEYAFRTTVRHDLASIPFVTGVNNHMGSLLTRHPGAMAWLMSELKKYGQQNNPLFFVDSYTTPKSVALQLADEYALPATRRDVFLDNKPTWKAIAAQFQRLIEIAKRDGHAVGIGHPYPATLTVLEKELKRLEEYGVELTSVRHIIALREKERRVKLASNRSAADKKTGQQNTQPGTHANHSEPGGTNAHTGQKRAAD